MINKTVETKTKQLWNLHTDAIAMLDYLSTHGIDPEDPVMDMLFDMKYNLADQWSVALEEERLEKENNKITNRIKNFFTKN